MPIELGDAVEAALTVVGVTRERVEKWVGRPCRCEERKARWNQLSRWARRVVAGKTEKAKQYLKEIIGD